MNNRPENSKRIRDTEDYKHIDRCFTSAEQYVANYGKPALVLSNWWTNWEQHDTWVYLDRTPAKTQFTRKSFHSVDALVNARFQDMITPSERGGMSLNEYLDVLHDLESGKTHANGLVISSRWRYEKDGRKLILKNSFSPIVSIADRWRYFIHTRFPLGDAHIGPLYKIRWSVSPW